MPANSFNSFTDYGIGIGLQRIVPSDRFLGSSRQRIIDGVVLLRRRGIFILRSSEVYHQRQKERRKQVNTASERKPKSSHVAG